MINSLVGMQAFQQKIDTIANNLANINTTGYKSREVFFQDILSSRMNQPEDFLLDGRKTPIGLDKVAGSRVSQTFTSFQQGQQLETGVATDMMLKGADTFFTISPREEDPSEITNHQYTRDGHFQLDANRYLVTDIGDFVLNTDNEPISVPEGAVFNVDPQGRIMISYSNEETEELTAIKVTRINTPQALMDAGNNKYLIPEVLLQSELPVIDEEFSLVNPQYATSYSVIQGSLEGANIDLVNEMTQLTEAQRAYQFHSRSISIADQMMSMANSLRR